MSNSARLKAAFNDPAAFRASLIVNADAGPRRFGDVCDPWQAADFASLDPAWLRVAGRASEGPARAWLERPRGHSKTSDLAVMATWALVASQRRLAGVAAAADRDQARLLLDAMAGLVRLNPWLASVLDVQRERVVNRHTDSELAVLSSDAPTSYGLTPDFVICDELVHWQKRDLWDSLLSAAAKRGSCLLLVITNAGFVDSWQWQTREGVCSDPGWLFSRLAGPCASWITRERLAEQERLLPSVAHRRLWLNEWTTGSGDALQASEIDAALTLSGPQHEAERGWLYVAGLDLGISRDASALAIVGKHVGYTIEKPAAEQSRNPTLRAMRDLGIIDPNLTSRTEYETVEGTGKLRLAQLAIWQPGDGKKVSVQEIERSIIAHHARFNLACVSADPWQARFLIERLSAQGIYCEPTDFTGSNLKAMCEATLTAFNERQLALYSHDALLADLRSLRVVEKAYGVRLQPGTSPKGEGTRHGDAAVALSLALLAARKIVSHSMTTIEGPLLVYP